MTAKEILNLDSLLTDRVRLAILTALATSKKELDFNALIEELGLSKGNLSVHVRKLEEAGYVKIEKAFVDRKSKTTYACTKNGRKALSEYLTQIEKILRSGAR